MPRGPLAGRYAPAAAMVVFALVPYLVLSAALQPIQPIIASQLHMSQQATSLASGMANACYAVGTVLALQFALRFPQRRMLIIYGTLLLIGSALAAGAWNPGTFIAGHVLQGLCTSLLLIAAVPPLAIGFPAAKFRWTAIILTMCIFGAVALGPTIGGIQANAHDWRPLFWIVAGIAAAALLLSLLTFDDVPPANPNARWNPLAIGLATGGCLAAFFGASELANRGFLGPSTVLPLLCGIALIIALLVAEYRGRCALLNVRPLVSTLPVYGIVIALFAAAASVSATALTASVQAGLYSPLHLGLLYLPQFAGAVVGAILVGTLFDKHQLQYLPVAGTLCLAAGIAVFLAQVPPTQTLTLIGSALTGIGLGATVAPALFVAGLSLTSPSLQRVFAIIELLRAVAAFMIAPIFVHFAATAAGSLISGTAIALWIGLGLALAGAVIAITVYVLGGARPQDPDIEGFLAGEKTGWYSPPLFSAVRERLPVSAAVQRPPQS